MSLGVATSRELVASSSFLDSGALATRRLALRAFASLPPTRSLSYSPVFMRWPSLFPALSLALVGFVLSCSSRSRPDPVGEVALPGQQADGAVLLPNQWFLRPAGRQVPLGDFPVNIALHPDSKYAAVLHCGYGQHEIFIVNLVNLKVVSTVALEEAFYGLTFSPDGKRLFCSGAGQEAVTSFAFADGFLSDRKHIKLFYSWERAIPCGLAISKDGKTLYVANVWAHRVSIVDVPSGTKTADILIGTNAISEVNYSDRLKRKTDEDEDAITKRMEALLDTTESNDPFPYACALDERRRRLYVTLWAQQAVAVIDLDSRKIIEKWPSDEHPNELVLTKSGQYLFVANANRNTVTVFDTLRGQAIETLAAELKPGSPPGSTPNSLSLDPTEKTLYVANANINAVAVFDVSTPGKSRSLGFIPSGWYPTSVRVTVDGDRLLVANGKGGISRANRNGPNPTLRAGTTVREYIAGLFQGSLSAINLEEGDKFAKQIKRLTAQTYQCLPRQLQAVTNANPLLRPATPEAGNPIPRKIGEPSPIHYVIYIIKENRTYDQVLGDMREGNGDPALCLFGEKVTPNHHKLAREFVLLDNFYVDGEVSADGHEWTVGAYATDFVEKSWPLTYGHNRLRKYPYPAEGVFAIAAPAGGYLWDRAKEAGVSYRSYGEFVSNGAKTNEPGRARVPSLKDHFDPEYRSFDMGYPDVKRAARFIEEFKRFEQAGEMPRLQIVRLPNDHTSGTLTNMPTPIAAVADNDLALGRLVEAVSRSKFWKRTAIFVVEDDAQNGADHVDAHRTVAFVISPWARHREKDSTMYSTSSMLRTIELILGLKPMSQFDAAALPMFNSFTSRPDYSTYHAEAARVDLEERNLKLAWGSELSRTMDFTREDAADDLLLNEIVWRSVKGPDSSMPAPKRAAFFLAHQEGDEDDD